jgi:hypothetical protein
VQEVISNLNPRKSSGYDLVTGKLGIAIKYLTHIVDALLFKGYFPAEWKVAQIVLLLKPGKPPKELTSYRPVSLLQIVSKVFVKLLLKRPLPLVGSNGFIPNHQFSFIQRQTTTEINISNFTKDQ